jgi:NADPH2:quinone reductase
MNHAIRIYRHGGPNELRWEEAPVKSVRTNDVLVRHTAIGVNFSDINVRRGGFYPNHRPSFPLVLGNEAAGVVESLGRDVSEFKVGDRVAYAGMHGEFYEETGSYSEWRIVPSDRLVKIPPEISNEQAAAILLKGSTASLVINRLFKPGASDTVLVHTAAAGVGSMLCQWSRYLGATVIGTVGSASKVGIAQANGCDHVIQYRNTDFVSAVNDIIPAGISAVFDGVGKDTFIPSLQCLRPFGKAVNYGNASGHVPPLDILPLAKKSLSVSRIGVTAHIRDTASLRKVAAELFDLVARNIMRPTIAKTYPLRNAASAHEDAESAKYSGALLLIPAG